jgi:hypothetical protein
MLKRDVFLQAPHVHTWRCFCRSHVLTLCGKNDICKYVISMYYHLNTIINIVCHLFFHLFSVFCCLNKNTSTQELPHICHAASCFVLCTSEDSNYAWNTAWIFVTVHFIWCFDRVREMHSRDKLTIKHSRDSSAGIQTRLWAWRPRDCRSIPGGDKRFFSPSKRPDGLCSSPSLMFSG